MNRTVKKNAKDVVLPHSQAKLDLYKNYLVSYLKVLTLAPFCTKINLFDVYCGTGVYQDGKIGSPIITNNTIRENNEVIRNMKKPLKPVGIYINDFKLDKIEKVQAYLENNKNSNCSYGFYNEDADKMLEIACEKVNAFPSTERNLIFIDPYGYSHIHKDKIYNLIKNAHTEIILFLPVMQMYRFKDVALSDSERTCYEDLRKFISSFFPHGERIYEENEENIFSFIHEIKEAFSFNKEFYTCSHYIERGKGNYYALFFITSNMYGLDKMVEAKWKLDPIKGKGFTQKSSQPGLFEDDFELSDNRLHLDFLKRLILNHLNTGAKLSNTDIYSLSLRNEFRAMDAKKVLKELHDNKLIQAFNDRGGQLSSIDGAYMDYTHYKKSDVKIIYKKR